MNFAAELGNVAKPLLGLSEEDVNIGDLLHDMYEFSKAVECGIMEPDEALYSFKELYRLG